MNYFNLDIKNTQGKEIVDNNKTDEEEQSIPGEDMYEDLKKEEEEKIEKQILEEDVSPIIYVRGVPSEEFSLILQGTVVICSG